MTFRFWTATTLCFALLLAIPACDQSASEEETTSEETADEESADDESAEETEDDSQEESADEAADAEEVEVAADGTDFDPPIQPEQLPDGVYYCDMGTVHWAGGEEPEESQCPRCGMEVKEYDSAERAEQEEDAAGDEHAHDHGEEGHDHDGDHDHEHGEGEHHEH